MILAEFCLCFHAHCGTQFCGIGANPENLNWIWPGGYKAAMDVQGAASMDRSESLKFHC